MKRLLWIICWGCLWVTVNGHAQTLLRYQPTHNDVQTNPIASDTRWRLTGFNHSAEPQLLIIQISNHTKDSYADRINEERTVLPGAFRLEIYPAELLTPKGKPLIINATTEFIVFTVERTHHIAQLQLEQIPAAPPLAELAWDFGPSDSAVMSGFEPIDETDPRIQQFTENSKAKAFVRQAPDPLVKDGISGINKLQLPAPAGRWMLHLWTEDYGEWQSLPMLTERRIRINGKDMLYQNISADEWIKKRYTTNKFTLAKQLSAQTASPLLDSWQLLGQQRGGLISLPVTSESGSITIELAGANRQATTLTALLLTKPDSEALKITNQQRAAWFQSRWPVLLIQPEEQQPNDQLISASTPSFIDFTLDAPYALSDITLESQGLSAHLRQRLPVLKRFDGQQNNPSGSLLAIQYELLSMEASADIRSRYFQVELMANSTTQPGLYAISLFAKNSIGAETLLAQHQVEVVATRLPPADRPLGVYLEMPPHLEHNYDLKTQAPIQLSCDIQQLSQLSITGLAPPLPMPDSEAQQTAVIQQIQQMQAAGIQMPIISYSGFKTLRYKYSANETGHFLQQLVQRLEAAGLASPVWSVADEPSNPSSSGSLTSTRDALRQGAQEPDKMLTAGHLNNPKDQQWLTLLDIALINDGFGVDKNDIERVRQSGATPWFYNLSNSRVAAGFYAWKHNIGGYLQWHARMPTADPYDPTDGREDDQQLLPVMSSLCAPVIDLDQKLVSLIEGITDFRWLRWLDQQAASNQQALRLKKRLLKEIPNRWQDAAQLKQSTLNKWRQAMILLSKDID